MSGRMRNCGRLAGDKSTSQRVQRAACRSIDSVRCRIPRRSSSSMRHARLCMPGQPGSLARRSTSVTSVSTADPLDGAAHSGVGDLGVYLTDEPGKACSG